MLESGVLALLFKAFAPLLEPLLNAVGRSINDYIDSQRADRNAKDLGSAEANLATEKEARAAVERELDAAIAAPKSVDDAIARLEAGTA